MHKSTEQKIHGDDLFLLMRKDNRKLILGLLIQAIIILFLVGLVFMLKDPKIKILRLYPDIAQNETLYLDKRVDNKIRRQDVALFSKFIIEHLDLKSRSAIFNLDKLLAVADEDVLRKLVASQDGVLAQTKNNPVLAILNTIENTDVVFKKDKKLLIVKINYSSLELLSNGKDRESEKSLQLAFRLVDRLKYENKQHLGGWYYGLMWVDMDKEFNEI